MRQGTPRSWKRHGASPPRFTSLPSSYSTPFRSTSLHVTIPHGSIPPKQAPRYFHHTTGVVVAYLVTLTSTPTASATVLKPSLSSSAESSVLRRAGRPGPSYASAVYSSTSDAPARILS